MSFSDIKSQARVWILALLGSSLIKLISCTLKWRQVGEIHPRITDDKSPLVYAFWHDSELLIHNFLFRTGRSKISPGLCAIASRHSDGRIIAGILARLGIKTVAGSSSSGGMGAVRGLARLVINEGLDCAIAPDGPKGPRHKMKGGVIKIAQIAGAPIVAVAYSAKNRWEFSSWDRMFLPKPFSPAVYAASKPIPIPREMDDDQFYAVMMTIEEALKEVTDQVNNYEYP